MTVSVNRSRVQHSGNGSTTAFAVTFNAITQAEIVVTVTTSGVDSVKTLGTHYTLTTAPFVTGTVTFLTSPTDYTPASGTTITISRNLDYKQLTDYAANDALDAETLEEAFDKAMMAAQQLDDGKDRTLKYSATLTDDFSGDEDFTTVSESASARADKALKFDSSGKIGVSTSDPDAQEALAAAQVGLATAQVGLATAQVGLATAQADEAEEWATKVDGYVSGSGNAAKAWSIGGTFVTDTALRGAAKEWATNDEDDLVDGTNYSAKHHSAKASAQVALATAQVTLATAAQTAAANSAAAVSAVYDDFADKYLGQMADGATATSGTANGTWAKNSSSITLASTSGTIEVGQLVAGTGIPAGSNILSIDGSTIVISNNMAALGSGVSLTFTGHGIYGAYNVAKDGPPTDNDNGTLATGMLYFNSTDNEMRIYDGGNWIAASAAGSASILEYKFVATASQTTFSGTDANGATLSYTASNLIVFLNGVRLDASDYTASNGTSIVLGSGAAVSDELVVVAFKSFTAADTVPASTGGTFSGNVAITGNLSVDTIEQQGSSGIVLSHDVKLASGTAIKNAAGTALLGEDGALGSGVTGDKIVKAWAHFEGDGTPTLTSNLNVSSVVSGGSAGRYLVSFSPALGGTAAVVGGLCDDIDTYGGNRGICTSSDNSSVFDHCKITTFVCSTATEGDMGDISIVVFSA